MKLTIYTALIMLGVGYQFSALASSDASVSAASLKTSNKSVVRLTRQETVQWLEDYRKNSESLSKKKVKKYDTSKMKEWCDRCTPADAYTSVRLGDIKNSALHLFCQNENAELVEYVLKKMYPKNFKKDMAYPFKNGAGPGDLDNDEDQAPLDLLPAGNWEMYKMLAKFGIDMDPTWKDDTTKFATPEEYFKAKNRALYNIKSPKLSKYTKKRAKEEQEQPGFFSQHGTQILQAIGIVSTAYLVRAYFQIRKDQKKEAELSIS